VAGHGRVRPRRRPQQRVDGRQAGQRVDRLDERAHRRPLREYRADQPIEVREPTQPRAQAITRRAACREGAPQRLPLSNGDRVPQRLRQPGAQDTTSHRGGRVRRQPGEESTGLGTGLVADHVQGGECRVVEDERVSRRVGHCAGVNLRKGAHVRRTQQGVQQPGVGRKG